MNDNGRILWEGPSNFDGSPIVVIATGFAECSSNAKTGAMIQTWIMHRDIAPNVAFKNGFGRAACGDCMHAGYNNGTCYVVWYQGPLSVWNCYKRGNYAPIGDDWHLFNDVSLRIGSAGDGAMTPASVWTEPLLRCRTHTAYTHQWRQPWAQHFKGIAQASCDGFADYLEATANGWHTYLVIPPGTDDPAGTVHCAASTEKGNKTNCARCSLCDGNSANVVIYAHGRSKNRYAMAN
jgi:hypothetical protein